MNIIEQENYLDEVVVSIVVPIYNVEKYLTTCIESILAQTYKKIEIILVNDGSTDASGEICESFAKSDKRIRVIHKKNGGLSDARNAGLTVAKGKYISFIDSDDYIDQEMIKCLLNAIVENQAEISICQVADLYEESGKITIPKSFEIESMENVEAVKNFFREKRYGYVVAWNKMYDISLFRDNDIEYPVGLIHEDCFTTYKLFYKAKKVVYIPEVLYIYRHRSGSIMGNKDIKLEYSIVEAYEQAHNFVKDNCLELDEVAEYRYVLTNLGVIGRINKKQDYKWLEKCSQNIKQCKLWTNHYFTLQQRARALLAANCPELYLSIMKLRNIIPR